MKATGIIALALGGSALLVGWGFIHKDRSENSILTPSEPTAKSINPKDTTDSHPRDETPMKASQDEPMEPVRAGDYLAEYWGERWPEIERGILELGGNLDAIVAPGTIASWEEVEPALRSIVLGGGKEGIREEFTNLLRTEMTEEQIRSSYADKLSEYELQELSDLMETYQPHIDSALDDLVEVAYSFRQRLWSEKRYAAGPLYPVGESGVVPEITSMMSTTGSVKGWSYIFDLDPKQDFLYEAAMQRVLESKLIRRRALRSYLKTHGH